MQVFQDLIEANSRYHQAFDAANLLPPPRRQLAVLTCMDCRIDTASVFGLDPGDAHVLRNAGARASDDAIRSLVVSTVKLEVRRIAVVHHTHCGAAAITQDLLVDEVLATTGADAHAIDFLLFDDPEQALRDDVLRLASCPYLPAGTLVAGFMYDVSTGLIRPATEILAAPDATVMS